MPGELVILVIVVTIVTFLDLVAQFEVKKKGSISLYGRYGGGEIQEVRVLRLISFPPRSLGLLLPTLQKLI